MRSLMALSHWILALVLVSLAFFACVKKEKSAAFNESATDNQTMIPWPSAFTDRGEGGKDDASAIRNGISEFSKKDARLQVIDVSKSIEMREAKALYTAMKNKYGAGSHCQDFATEISRRAVSRDDVLHAYEYGGSSREFPMGISDGDMTPFLNAAHTWLQALREQRPELDIYVNRTCLFITAKDDLPDFAGVWHFDDQGEITALWTLYGQTTWYTENERDIGDKAHRQAPPYGHLLFIKDLEHPDVKARHVSPVLHATPGKRGDRLTFVTFFRASDASTKTQSYDDPRDRSFERRLP